MSTLSHIPVMANEVISLFEVTGGSVLLDATVGLGGHARQYLECAPTTSVVGLDVDTRALAHAQQALEEYSGRVTLEHRSYAYLDQAVPGTMFHHILFDLGVGSHQLQDEERGISFRSQGPLAMRFTAGSDVVELPPSDVQVIQWLEKKLGYIPDVDDVIAGASEDELADIIRTYGQERYAGRIARTLKELPRGATATQAAEVIAQAVPKGYERGRIHPATRTFQALRIVVNRELESLTMALPKALTRLEVGGKLIVISFHSLEDRIVKQFFKRHPNLNVISKKPLVPTEEEKAKNPRSRSAKLRVAQKT